MPDMSLCANDKCPLKTGCYRYRAVPNGMWQSWTFFEPDSENNCRGFMEIAGRKTRRMSKIAEERKQL
jgi:hypothetical protein